MNINLKHTVQKTDLMTAPPSNNYTEKSSQTQGEPLEKINEL